MSRTSRRALAWAMALAVVFGVLFAIGFVPRRSRAAQLESARTAADAVVVTVVHAQRAPGAIDVTLPGTVQAYQFTYIYARANGYVKRRLVDIGDDVKAGQLLAELETPELDEELRQARAALGQAHAAVQQAKTNLELARINLERSRNLRTRGIVPAQDSDDKQAAYEAQQAQVDSANANVAASEANVERLVNLQGFKRVVAPFDGTITFRSIDPGALVTANTGANGRELFRIGQGDTVRIYVNVPQAYAAGLQAKSAASVTLQERAGRAYEGTVVRTAGALDPESRTLLTEVQVANKNRELLAGMYVDVKIHVTRPDPPLMVPASALVIRNDGPHVALATTGRVAFPKVQLGRDFGTDVEINSGIADADLIVVNPSGSLSEGQAIRTAVRPPAAAASSVR